VILEKWSRITINLPFGYLTVCHGKSSLLIGTSSINGSFSIAMLNNQRVYKSENTPIHNNNGSPGSKLPGHSGFDAMVTLLLQSSIFLGEPVFGGLPTVYCNNEY